MQSKFEGEGFWNPIVYERYFIEPKYGGSVWEYYVIANNSDNYSYFGFVPTEGPHGSWMLYSDYDLKHIAKSFGNDGVVHDLDFEPIKFSLLANKLNHGL